MKLHHYSKDAFSLYDFMTPEACQALIVRAEALGFEVAKIDDGLGQVHAPSVRNNSRVIFDDEKFAAEFFEQLLPFLPSQIDDWRPKRLNERFRFYKYDRFQNFNWHRDLPYKPNPSEASKLTFMIYLNDDFQAAIRTLKTLKFGLKSGWQRFLIIS